LIELDRTEDGVLGHSRYKVYEVALGTASQEKPKHGKERYWEII
jgi:hypothetical protein